MTQTQVGMNYKSFIENNKNISQSKRDSAGSMSDHQRLVHKMVAPPFVPLVLHQLDAYSF